MAHEVQFLSIKGVQGSLQQKVLARSSSAQPPQPNIPLQEPSVRFLAAQAGSKSSLFESRVLSPTWHSFSHRPGLHSQPSSAQRHGSLQSGCLSAQVMGAHRWPVPSLQHSSFQTSCHRIFPNETSPFLCSLALATLTSSHFQPLPFFLNTSFPLQALSFFTKSSHFTYLPG